MTNHIFKGRHTLPIVVAGVFVMALVLISLPHTASATTTYNVESYSSNSYSTVKNDFWQGETVYGKGWKSGGNEVLKLVFRNPSNTVVKDCPSTTGTVTTCNYDLASNAPTGEWDIKLYQRHEDEQCTGPWWHRVCETVYSWDEKDQDHFNVKAAVCGNHKVEGLEACDEGHDLNGDPNHCNSTCSGITTPVCGNDVKESGEQCDGDKGCSESCTWEPVTVVASKIICDNESDLPNWGLGYTDPVNGETYPSYSPKIGKNAVSSFLETKPNCHVAQGWGFQYEYANNIGAWHTFSGTTGSDGSVTETISDLNGTNEIHLREVEQAGYIPFSYDGEDDNNVSAEFYCYNDMLHYDNYDFIRNAQPGQTYYCVAFNVKKTAPVTFEKVIQGEGDPNDWTFTYNGETYKNGETVNLPLGGGIVTENGPDGYSFVGASGICSEDGNVYIDITSEGGTCTFTNKQDTYDLHGYKWNDVNGNGVYDCTQNQVRAEVFTNINTEVQAPTCEPKLNGWRIFIDANDNNTYDDGEQSMLTQNHDGQDGWYWFEGLPAGTYKICEVQQSGWKETYPATCHTITLPYGQEGDTCGNLPNLKLDALVQNAVLAPMCNFGNQVIPATCGDGEKNQESEQCDGTDGITGGQTCTAQCTIVNPAAPVITFTIAKKVDKATANPNDTLTYTVTVTNTGNAEATNVTLTDTLPSGLTFLDANGNNTGDTTKSWTWPTIAAGASETVTYKVHVDSNATAKQYVNTATVKADGVPGVTANATSEVKTPTVLGQETATLSITKTAVKTTVNPGGAIDFTVVVTNTGTAPATNVILTDTVPQGMVFADNNTVNHSWNLGDLVPSESVTTTYQVKVDAGTIPGKYVNKAIASADDVNGITAQVTFEVVAGQVLGAETEEVTTLPETGASVIPSLIAGLSILGSGLVLAKRGKK